MLHLSINRSIERRKLKMQWCVAINMDIQLLFTDEPVDIEK